jgi:hypothetical protein
VTRAARQQHEQRDERAREQQLRGVRVRQQRVLDAVVMREEAVQQMQEAVVDLRMMVKGR